MSVYVTLMGGFANQAIQYLAACKVAEKLKTDVVCDLSFLHSQSESQGFTVRKYRLNRLANAPRTCDSAPASAKRLPFDSADVVGNEDNVLLCGYFQQLKYMPEWSDLVHRCRVNLSTEAEILTLSSAYPAVGIHVRRGDYVNNPAANAFHGTLGVDYYKAALRRLGVERDAPVIYFTDDLEWTKNVLIPEIPNEYYLASDYALDECEEWEMLSRCTTIIMANSSFSWLAALAAGSIRATYPAKWFACGEKPEGMFDSSDWLKI